MGEGVASSQALPIKPGRYLMPLGRRLFMTAEVLGWLGYVIWSSVRTPDPVSGGFLAFFVVVFAVSLGLDVAAWFVPITVVDQWGIHRRIGRHRHTPWFDVYGVRVAGPGAFAWVEVELASARSVGLLGVPVSALRVPPGGSSARELYQARQLAPSHPSDADSDPWRNPDS